MSTASGGGHGAGDDDSYELRLIRVFTEAEAALITPYRMIDSLLYLPHGSGPDVPRPGVVFVHGWSRYPYDELARSLAPLLARRGVAVLSLAMRRRGGEGQGAALPDDDLTDIRLGLDALAHFGVNEAVLVGQDVGATSVARYLAATGDTRVLGLALVDPLDDPNRWLSEQITPERLADATDLARQAAYEMKDPFVCIDIDAPIEGRPPLWIMQSPLRFLAWWGGSPKLRLSRALEDVARPVLLVASSAAELEPFSASAGGQRELRDSARSGYAELVAEWAAALLPRPIPPLRTELVTVTTEGGLPLVGYLRTPVVGTRPDAAVLIVHGLTTGPFSPMARQFMCHYADHGFASLAMESRRSGYRAVAESRPEFDVADIDAFVELLIARGYPKVVLVGASQGSYSVSSYIAARHHPAVVAAVHLAPSGESGTFYARGIGSEKFDEIVAEARAAVADGHPEHLLVCNLVEPPPARFASTRRHYWRAASWLAWWADIRSHLELLAECDVATLLVAGSADDYNDDERMGSVRAALAGAPIVDEIWYPADHALKGVEPRVVADIARWLEKNGLVESRPAPPAEPGSRPAEPTPRLGFTHVKPPVPA